MIEREIWIVGGSGAIGEACGKKLARNDRNQVYASGRDVDVCSTADIEQFLNEKAPDVLVYAAGVTHLDWSEKIDLDEMSRVYDVNVLGLIRCIQSGLYLNRVVVIGSDAARRPMRTSIAYNASKAALEAAVKVIARERAGKGFFINIVAPGLIEDGEMTRYVYERTAELRPGLDLEYYMLNQIPAGYPGQTTEVAEVVRWLVEDAPDYLNGAVIDVNGAR